MYILYYMIQRILAEFIYITLAIFSLGIPILWLCCYMYLSFLFSGFPYLSREAKSRLNQLSAIGSVWTLMRLLWGVVALTSVMKGWFQEISRVTEYYTLVLVSAVYMMCVYMLRYLYFVCYIIIIIILVYY